MPDSSPRSPWRWLVVLVMVVVAAGGAVFAWVLMFHRLADPPADPEAAAAANARGVGHMERFTESKAVAEFEAAARLAPDWQVPKINLGIALLNTARSVTDPVLDRALGIFADVLKAEPDNPHALYSSGIIHLYRNDLEAAHKCFARVVEVDPVDAYAVYYRGLTRPDEPTNPESKKDYEAALKLNPHLNTARYRIAQHGHDRDDQRNAALLAEWNRLMTADAENVADIKYTLMGRYAEVIGGSPVPPPAGGPMPLFAHVKPTVTRAPTWVVAAPGPGPIDGLGRATRDRFGSPVVLFDYNRDGRTDVLLPSGATDGVSRDVLLRNDGANAFTNVTAEIGLADHTGSIGAAVADFDNDGWPDVAVTGSGGVGLFRNVDGKRFENKGKDAGLTALTGYCLGVAWLDLDQDGDLDLVVARYADGPTPAAKLLAGETLDAGGRLAVFANVGVAPPFRPGEKAAPLTCKFQPADWFDRLNLAGPVVGVVALDIDGDRDVDLLVQIDGQQPVRVLNDRLGRFSRGPTFDVPASAWNGGLAIDADGDDRSDVFSIPKGKPPHVTRPGLGKEGRTDATPLRQAHRCDLDLDGRADVVGLGPAGKPAPLTPDVAGKPVFLRGDGAGAFAYTQGTFGPSAENLPGLAGVAVGDFDGDGHPDLFAVADDGPHLFRNLGSANRGVRLVVTGKRDEATVPKQRTNTDGIGAKVVVQAGPVRSFAELTTATAGLGQSRVPLHLGIGKAPAADVVRVRWPDFVVQAELNPPADGVMEIVELNRMPSSCPVLFTWDGRRFAYIADFLGGGAVGETGPDGSIRPPRPEESVKVEADQLAPRNGKYVVKVTEPMDEVMYLDRLRLDVIDHPADVVVFPDERFATADPQPTQELLAFRERVAPVKATDHRGRDVTAKLRHRDRDAVDGYAVRSWLGFAEEHSVELDFGTSPFSRDAQRSADVRALLRVAAKQRLFLVLAGWTEYAFPESIYAATQAGVPVLAPVLEQKQPDGTWKSLGDLGFPAGLTRVMTADVTGRIDPAGGPVRIRTNLQIYWDQIFLAPVAGPDAVTVRELPVSRAVLEYAGFAQEVTPGGKPPVEYDHARREAVAVTKWTGRLTRSGDVTELLSTTDDRHAIAGPGDEVTAEFDAAGLPPVKAGWVRSFVLRTWGYCKDTAPTTASGGRVGPVPYRGMPAYPYDESKVPPAVAAYDREWNTRPAAGGGK